MGSDASALYEGYKAMLADTTEKIAEVSKSSDFEGTTSAYAQ
jgi:hypothetical protein